MSLPPFVAWLDLETTGTDERTDPIIEVGVLLTDDSPDMAPVDEFSVVVNPGEAFWVDFPLNVSEVVYEMHEANGLWADCRASTHDVAQADADLRAWLQGHCGKSRVALGGSGVSHFDRRFIAAQMPASNNRLTYWALDVGAVRRMIARSDPDRVHPQPEGGKAHRALPDATDHRDEWVAYETMLRPEEVIR